MNYSNSKKHIISILFAGSIFIASFLPISSIEVNAGNIMQIEKTDSTKVKSLVDNKEKTGGVQDKLQKAKHSSNLSYNIIYFLISKFIKTNPLSRPK